MQFYGVFFFFFLQDQFDNVNSHTHKGIEFCDRYMRFVKERCEIENEYASKLK